MLLRTLALSLSLALLAACGGQAPDPTPTAPAQDAAPAPAEPAPADEAPSPEATPEQAAPVEEEVEPQESTAAPATPVGPAPVEGRDYTRIEPATLAAPAPGKIEVVEVFGYTCPACARLQPHVNAWKARLSDDVNFLYVPAAFGGYWTPYASAFYAAEAMGVRERTHDAMFRALHEERSLPIAADAAPRIALWYGQHGVDAKAFASTMESFAVNAKLARSQQLLQRWGIDATPTLIVAGRYKVMATAEGGHAGMLRTVDWLVAQERSAADR